MRNPQTELVVPDEMKGRSMEQILAQMEARKVLRPTFSPPPPTSNTDSSWFLLGSNGERCAFPNSLARSSLFAVIAERDSAGKKVKTFQGELLISRKDAQIKYWGVQLDEQQATIWTRLVNEASKAGCSDFTIILSQFLADIGMGTGGKDFSFLKTAINELTFAMLTVETFDKRGTKKISVTRSLRLVDSFERFGDFSCTVKIDPRWIQIFGGKVRDYGLIDWAIRKKIGPRQQLAKSLQRLLAASTNQTQYFQLAWLKARSGYGGRARDFRTSLKGALNELKRVGIVENSEISKSSKGVEQVTISLVTCEVGV